MYAFLYERPVKKKREEVSIQIELEMPLRQKPVEEKEEEEGVALIDIWG